MVVTGLSNLLNSYKALLCSSTVSLETNTLSLLCYDYKRTVIMAISF